MNKKIATLLFALGLGAGVSPLVAAGPWSCSQECYQEYRMCLADGGTRAECSNVQKLCEMNCHY